MKLALFQAPDMFDGLRSGVRVRLRGLLTFLGLRKPDISIFVFEHKQEVSDSLWKQLCRL